MKPNVTNKYLNILYEANKQKILNILFKYPEREFSLSELAKEAHIAKPHIGKTLDELLKIGMIRITKLTKIWRIKAEQTNFNFIKSKIVYNLNFIYQSGIIEYLNEIFRNPRAIVLFGSFRKGEDISGSDIDIAIESDEFGGYEVVGLRELIDFEKVISRRIQLHKFNRRDVDINVFNSIANGIVLMGFLEVKP